MTATATRHAEELQISVRIAAAPADSSPHDRTHLKQAPTMTPIADPALRPGQTSELTLQDRNRDMYLMHEALARAHMQQLLGEAEQGRLARRLLRARRLKNRAERASLRARRALAIALMQ